MNISHLGKLKRDSTVPEWFKSSRVAVPYFEGLRLPFTLRDIGADPSPADFENAVAAFFRLTSADRLHAGRYAFRLYRRVVEEIGEDEFSFTIPDVAGIWHFIRPTGIHISRRVRGDRSVYVEILAECQWDIEHGLAIIYRRGSDLTRVSNQDGHLTTADAFGFPEERDTIMYEG